MAAEVQETRLFAFLREQARQRNMGQNAFARWLGISPSTMSAIRHGHTPTLDLVKQLAEKLDVPVNDLAELAGILEQPQSVSMEDLPPEARTVLRRLGKFPPERQQSVLRMIEQLITFAEAQTQ